MTSPPEGVPSYPPSAPPVSAAEAGYPAPPGYTSYPGHTPPPPIATPPFELADMGRRLGARLIDGLILTGLILVLLLVPVAIAAITGQIEQEDPPLWIVVTYLVLTYVVIPAGVAAYEAVPIGLRGATPGKAMLGIRVVDQHTLRPIGIGMGTLRWLIPAAASMVCFGSALVYLSPYWDESGRRQGWHDRPCKSLVIRR